MSKKVQKRLAAIMFTHLVEYDVYLKDDENFAIKVLNEHKKVLDKTIKSYNGKIIKYLDNRCFIDFSSATDAVRGAINLHLNFKKENSQNPDTFQMNLRIGIHMGEVYEENNDLFGEGVNLAARIESIAKPGGTVITQAIYNSVRSEDNLYIRDMGRVLLKNIKEPERVFKIYNDETEYSKETNEELTKKLIKKNVTLFDKKIAEKSTYTIAINYIKNLGSEENEFFCYGLTEDLILESTKISNLKIVQINQIIKHKDSELEIHDLANVLKADYILNGNIMKMGENFRLSLQFHDIGKSSILWNESWESNTSLLSDTKGKILFKLLDSLNIDIPDYIKDAIIKDQEVSPEAYELFIKGKYLSNTSKNKVDREIVQDLYRRAIKTDQNFIEPRCFYAFELMYMNQLERAIDVLDDALVIAKKNKDDSGTARIKTAYGIMYKNWGRYEQSIKYFEDALEIRVKEKNLQDEAKVLNGLAQCYVLLADNEKSFEYYNRSLDIKRKIDDKQGVAAALSNMSLNYRRVADYAKAIEYSKEAIELFDELGISNHKNTTQMNLGTYQVIIGHLDEAEKNLKESLKFMLEINDFKSAGMAHRYLGLIELNKQEWLKAQNYFKRALKEHQKAEHRPAFEATTLFLGLSYYYNKDYELAEKFINKAVQITQRRKNVSFYGQTAKAVEIMLKSKLGQCSEKDIDGFVVEIENDLKNDSDKTGWISREYWYISQSFLNLDLT